jgi:membrane-bound ClpP family serine protease
MTELGVGLMVLGAVVIMVETHVPAYGALGGPGVLMLTICTVLAIAGLGGGIALGVVGAVLVGLIGAGGLAVSLRTGLSVRRRAVRTGREGLIGHLGVVRTWTDARGSVVVDGALWTARESARDEPGEQLHEGDEIVVEHLNGLTLSVRRAEEWELI